MAAYVPVGSEPGGPDLPFLLAAELPPDGRLLLPVLLPDNDLDWAVFTGTLTAATRGLLEPTGPRLGPDALRTADLALLPALAVSRDGTRMGRGGGSYDRALARLPLPAGTDPTAATLLCTTPDSSPPTGTRPPARSGPGPLIVALLHDGEDVETVPAEPHDRRVQAVLTPSGGFSWRPLSDPL
ncbi:hypothetical protein GCM10025331_14950 [Actinoplanes utahensis]|nr:hypothetical protein Aut01nite_22160 [Actinoplanes utahensis]